MRPVLTALAGLALIAACEKPATPVSAPIEPAAVDAPEKPSFDIDPALPSDPDSIADGRTIAVSHCAICHGIDQEESLRADAPPLRYILSLYSPQSLSEDFRYGIHVGHEDMPDFVFGDLGMDVLLAYLVSIQETPPAAE